MTEECDFVFTETMSERKACMEEEADAFIALPGGIGTYEEFFEVLTLKQLGRHRKPMALLNTLGFTPSDGGIGLYVRQRTGALRPVPHPGGRARTCDGTRGHGKRRLSPLQIQPVTALGMVFPVNVRFFLIPLLK